MRMVPYSRQWLDEEDIQAVVEVLRSDWLTTGPKIEEFESAFANFVGTREAVAISSGTAALHAAVYAAQIGPGDEVIVPAMTFAASANCVVYQGGIPVFADVESDTLLIDPVSVEARITPRTKAIIAVDYAGQPCNYDLLREIARKHKLMLIADACHSLGGVYKMQHVGSLADLNVFSFHPVKPITTGEGGMISTNDPEMARRMRIFRNHGITTDHRQREQSGDWFYEMTDLGYNYRLTDFQCALGISQMTKLKGWIERRQHLAGCYDQVLPAGPGLKSLKRCPDISHAYHLYVIRVSTTEFGQSRAAVFQHLRKNGIRANVHYVPVHLHPFYRNRLETRPGLCPVAERAYEEILSLPIYPQMSDEDVTSVVSCLLASHPAKN